MPVHPVRWLSPTPLWREVGALNDGSSRTDLARPTILRFANDDFVDEYLGILSYRPERLVDWVARYETWREPSPTPSAAGSFALAEPVSIAGQRLNQLNRKRKGISPPIGSTGLPSLPDDVPVLKLYQPAQQRFYMVTASLICQQPGLPDRAVDDGKQETVGFVVRRLVPPTTTDLPTPDDPQTEELAFVTTADGPRWVPAPGTPAVPELAAGEQRLPMFTTTYFDDNRGQKRRLLGGLIPVARREAYLGAPKAPSDLSEPADDAALDARMVLFDAEVAAPWRNMLEQADLDRQRNEKTIEGLGADAGERLPPIVNEFENPPANDGALTDTLRSARESIQTISWYVLIDFAAFIKKHWKETVWERVKDASFPLSGADETLAARLEGFVLSSQFVGTLKKNFDGKTREAKLTLIEALREIADKPLIAENLEKVETDYKTGEPEGLWPNFLFPLADPGTDPAPTAPLVGPNSDLDIALAYLSDLATDVQEALPTVAPAPQPATASSAKIAKEPERMKLNEGYFILRCVYERPNCDPFAAAVVSGPSEMFEMASFFDADAPARPIRIPMPADVSPAGLRKYAKNTSFLISDSLCGRIKRFRGITLGDLVLSVLPWPFHKDLPNVGEAGPCRDGGNPIGMFCSLSIPIVTLCALILLFVIVALFDMFFRWLPLLITCFPIRGFLGKKEP